MNIFRNIFNFYINSSIHVGLSCYALTLMAQHTLNYPANKSLEYFVFFGTVTGYNFVKYFAIVKASKKQISAKLKQIVLLSSCTFMATLYYYFQLNSITKAISILFLGLTLLYTLPFFPNKQNARNWVGIKIYIVSFCWTGVTVLLPIINEGIHFELIHYTIAVQRFILVFVLILIFEIIDLRLDDPHLKTVPQQIGIKQTKNLGYILTLLFFGLELLKNNTPIIQLQISFSIAMIIAFLLLFAHEKRNKYYTLFWVESIPILWWLMTIKIV